MESVAPPSKPHHSVSPRDFNTSSCRKSAPHTQVWCSQLPLLQEQEQAQQDRATKIWANISTKPSFGGGTSSATGRGSCLPPTSSAPVPSETPVELHSEDNISALCSFSPWNLAQWGRVCGVANADESRLLLEVAPVHRRGASCMPTTGSAATAVGDPKGATLQRSQL